MELVRFGLLGYGAWGREHARIIAENERASLVAVAEGTIEGRKEVEKVYSARTYPDYKELIANESLDVIDITLPDYLHYEAAVAALEAGNNVLLEKPMALTLEECDNILKLVEEQMHAGRKAPILAIGFELRASPLWGRIKELIQQGKIGVPRALNMEVFRCAPYPGSGGWRRKKNRASEWILDGVIHYIDLIRWYFEGITNPQMLRATANSAHEEALIENFCTTIQFSNGAFGVLFYTVGAYKNYITAKIVGEEGALWAYWGEGKNNLSPEFFLEYGKERDKQRIAIEGLPGEVFDLESEIKQVIRAVQEGGPVPATGEDGREAVRLCLAAARSLESGATVEL